MERWWELWYAECRRHGVLYTLSWALFKDGRTAVGCWTRNGLPAVVLDRPLAEALIARNAGFMMLPWIQAAILQYEADGGIVTIPLPRRWRRIRRDWMNAHPQ